MYVCVYVRMCVCVCGVCVCVCVCGVCVCVCVCGVCGTLRVMLIEDLGSCAVHNVF